MAIETRFIRISGRVQGVGFRPFIYRLALSHSLTGQVQNSSGMVDINVQGTTTDIEIFEQQIIAKCPPLAEPEIKQSKSVEYNHYTDFKIISSSSQGESDIHAPPDFFTCDACLQELTDPAERRFRYPFINCTQCGPRYSIIKALPYDRVNTTLAAFPLCKSCAEEYTNPLDRRFHAQPLACQQCGPELNFTADNVSLNGNEESLKACVKVLKKGQIVAIKGVGGYHLMCDALNDDAVLTLRQRKCRPDKPLAVMFPMSGRQGLQCLLDHVTPTPYEINKIVEPIRPIVLVKKKMGSGLSPNIAPGLNELGVFLPYSPLHHLLLNEMDRPLVATSGNISGEPVLTDNFEAENKLGKIADAFLHHNRPIERPADDSVIRVIQHRARTIRAGRGMAPVEINLNANLTQPIIAVGGFMKVTVALAWKNRCVISPHISDLSSLRGQQVFNRVIEDLQFLYGIKAEKIVCDAHPGYASHQWAQSQAEMKNLAVETIYHHHAHAGVISGSFPALKKWLCFCWDGVGLGQDNTLWGGEAFIGSSANWQRVASFKPFLLTGGDKAGRQPWRSEAALRWENNESWLPEIKNSEVAFKAWQKKINSPQSSAVGRLFDAAACMVLGITEVSFEGQGPMLLESIADDTEQQWIDLPLLKDEHGILRSDWSELLPMLCDDKLKKSTRAALFHNSLAQALIKQALTIREFYAFESIGLSGGVFQNKLLTESIFSIAETKNIKVYLPDKVPVNDGGLSFGQVIEHLSSKPMREKK